MESLPETGQSGSQTQGDPPPQKQQFVVVTDRKRCVGYRDSRGIWRSTVTGQPIRHVIAWEALLSQ